MSEKRKIIVITGVTLAVYIGIKFLLPYVLPFLVAWILVRVMNPVLKKIRSRLPWKKEVLVSILVFLVFAAAGLLLYVIYQTLTDQICRIVSNFDRYYEELNLFVDDCCISLEERIGIKAERLRSMVNQGMERVEVQVDGKLIPGLLNHSVQYLIKVGKAAGFIFIVYIAMLLLMKDYDSMKEKLEQYEVFCHVKRVADRLLHMGGAYLKSQFIILSVITGLCVGGLYLLGNSYALLVGIMTGILDALPFLGTGTILLPWAVVLIFRKKYWLALGYAILFLITNTVRELLEPRLVGNKIGIYPFVFALSVYAGLCLFGPAGVITGPVGLLLIMEICREIINSGEVCIRE